MAITLKTVIKTAFGSIPGNTDMYNGANVDEILTDLVSQINAKLTSAMHYCGTVATYDSLPTTNVEVGDVYNVTDTGKNYACSATTPAITWDELSGVMDLSAYKTDAQNELKYLQITNLATAAEDAGFRTETEINGLITAATADLVDETTFEVFQQSVNDSLTSINAKDAAQDQSITSLGNQISAVDSKADDLEAKMAAIAAVTMPTRATVTLYELYDAVSTIVSAAAES